MDGAIVGTLERGLIASEFEDGVAVLAVANIAERNVVSRAPGGIGLAGDATGAFQLVAGVVCEFAIRTARA